MMALRIIHSERLAHHVRAIQSLLPSERMLSSAARPAVIMADSSHQKVQEQSHQKVQEQSHQKVQEQSHHQETKLKLVSPFRTTENDPRNHNDTHLARYYTVPEDVNQTLFKHGGLTRKFSDLCHVFTETSIMVRKPFLEVKNYVEKVDFSKPAVRIVLYGRPGQGKSITLAHVAHYGHKAGFMLVHVPWVNTFMRRCKDASPSDSKPGMMDVPINAAAWLVHFRTQNQHLLQTLNLKTSKSYQYGPRDTLEKGSPLDQLIEFGVGRAKYACDVVEDLLREIKSLSNKGLFKTMVVIDGFNGLYSPFIITERRQVLNARCTLALPFLEITQFDWSNGVIVLSVDQLAHHDIFNAKSDLPHYLLGKEGWEHLDPFIPLSVDKFNTAEMNSALEYYIDRKWLQHPSSKSEAGKAELRALCAGNGHDLMKLCAPL